MFIVGFDLGKRKSQVCVEDADGNVIAELRIKTTREEIVRAFSKFPEAHVLIEASTSSEWVARLLESIGCVVVVADPRFSLMYAQRDKKVKNDRRDAKALAEALRLKAFRRAYRRPEETRKLHGQLLVRDRLVRMRTELINLVRALCEREGVIVPSTNADRFSDAFEEVKVDPWLDEMIRPALEQIETLTERIATADQALELVAKASPVARNLRTVRGVGPLTSLAFIAAIDDPKRFSSAREVSSYLGLVPGEHNSAESKRPPHAITKTGDRLVRAYLVEAAHVMTNKLAPDSPLKRWHAKIAEGSSKNVRKRKKAAVAVARRLSRILWAMWRDNKPFDPSRTKPTQSAAPAKEAA